MQTIPVSEVRFHPHSFADPSMRLFSWNGGLYRAIGTERAAFFRQFLDSGLCRELVRQGLLIDSSVVDLRVDGFETVVQHPTLPLVSYPIEWCPSMLRDASLAMVDLSIALASRDLTIMDGHPWNVVFDGCRPVFVDIGSVQPAEANRWKAFDEFCRYCYRPLQMMAHGQGRVARLLMAEDGGVTAREFRDEAGLALADLAPQAGHQSQAGYLEQVRREVESIPLPPSGEGHTFRDSAGESSPTVAEPVQKLLKQLRPANVLDIGCGDGWCSRLAAEQGSRVVAFDERIAGLESLYNTARRRRLPISPLVMDFSKPTPSRGLGENSATGAAQRLRCELVIALDVVPELVARRSLNFVQIAGGIADFTARWALVDFVPRESASQPALREPRFAGYTRDAWREALRERFREVQSLPETDGRALFLCVK